MNAQLDHEEHFQLSTLLHRPVGVVEVNGCAFRAATNHARKPRLVAKKSVGKDCGSAVKAGVEYELGDTLCLDGSELAFILVVYDAVNSLLEEVEVGVFDCLYGKMSRTKKQIKLRPQYTKESSAKT